MIDTIVTYVVFVVGLVIAIAVWELTIHPRRRLTTSPSQPFRNLQEFQYGLHAEGGFHPTCQLCTVSEPDHSPVCLVGRLISTIEYLASHDGFFPDECLSPPGRV